MRAIDGYGDKKDGLWIKRKKAQPFLALFDGIASRLGSKRAAAEYIGSSHNIISGIQNLKITDVTARKILSAHKRLNK